MKFRTIFGLLLIILGVGFFLAQVDLWDFGEIVRNWWPLLIIFFGLYKIGTDRNSIVFGIMIFIAGIILLALKLELLPGDFWDYFWPLLIIIVGISLLTNKHKRKYEKTIDDKEINEFVVFGGTEQIISSDDFKGGSITAMFGGGDYNLRNAKIPSGSAYLELTAAFGGIELHVPENWKLDISGTPVLGGMENKTRQIMNENEAQPVLKIKYTAIFGGIDIKN